MTKQPKPLSTDQTKDVKYDDDWIAYHEVRRLRKLCNRLVKLNEQRNKIDDEMGAMFGLGIMSIDELCGETGVLDGDDCLAMLQEIINARTAWLIDATIQNLKEKRAELGFKESK